MLLMLSLLGNSVYMNDDIFFGVDMNAADFYSPRMSKSQVSS